MRRGTWVAVTLLAAGCPGGDKDSGEACQIVVKSVYPSDGSTDGYYRAAIDFELSNPDPNAVITTDIPGEQVSSSDGKHVTWEPTEFLTPATQYSATLAYCGGDESTTFTTSSAGLPLEDRDALVGSAYVFDLHSGRVPIPAGLGDVLIENLGAVILIGVTGIGVDTIDLIGAVSQLGGTSQDYCAPTIPFPGADFSEEPFVSFSRDSLTLVAEGQEVDVFDVVLTGTFSPDGSQIEGMTFTGLLDTRPLAPLVQSGDLTELAICNLAENFGTTCVACPNGAGDYCLLIEADHITAASTPEEIVEICEANAAECDPGPPADTCD